MIDCLVCGEALVDLIPSSKADSETRIPGGSPLNVAVGLARLGVPTGFLGKISSDTSGQLLIDHLAGSNVDMRFIVPSSRPTTEARLESTAAGQHRYVFRIEGTADRSLQVDELPTELPEGTRAIHCGSYSMALEPIGTALTKLLERECKHRVISFDPNVRLSLILDRSAYMERFDHWVSLSHVVKLSEEDLAYLCPQQDAGEEILRWLCGSTRLVVVTKGDRGAIAHTRSFRIESRGMDVEIRDTVGAGDAFMSGLLAWLHDHNALDVACLDRLGREEVADALRFANLVAAVACSRRGANPPTLAELNQERRPG